MDTRLVVTIPRTRDRIYASFMRKRLVTVRIIQEYSLSLALYTGELYIVHRRYSEFAEFRCTISKVARKLRLTLPRFPPKTLWASRSKVKQLRRELLETWVRSCFSYYELLAPLVDFLRLPEFFHMILTEPNKNMLIKQEAGEKLNELEFLIGRFADLMHSNKAERLDSLIHAFTTEFFNKPQKVRPATMSLLLRFLIELVRDDALAFKSIKFVNRLCNQNYFSGENQSGYVQVTEELVKFDIELLAEMKLNLFIRGENNHLKAETLKLVAILKEVLSRDQRSRLLVEIVRDRQLNRDTEAIGIVFKRDYLSCSD